MTGSGGPIRAFIAVAIPPAAKSALGEVIQGLVAQVPSGVRWVDPAAMHLTLKFLGNVEPGLIDEIAGAMGQSAAAAPPFQVHLSGLGMFPNERRPGSSGRDCRATWRPCGGSRRGWRRRCPGLVSLGRGAPSLPT